MNREEYRRMFEVQDEHWWFAGKRIILASLLAQIQKIKPGLILDLGCGTGANSKLLENYGKLISVDDSGEALKFLPESSLALNASLANLPLCNDCLQGIALIDVLYHMRVTDVSHALKEVCRVCSPGGWVIISDSALPWLFSSHDKVVHAARRFTKSELSALVSAAGFEVTKISYSNFFIFPALATWRVLSRVFRIESGHSDLSPSSALVNKVMNAVYRLEALVLTKFNLPFGSSLVCLAFKR